MKAYRFLFPILIAGFTPFLLTSCEYNTVSVPPTSDPDPTFSNVSQILMTGCGGSNCHIGRRTSGVRLDSYENVTGSRGDQYGKNIVQPGNAPDSPIINKIEPGPQYGSRMPFGRQPLPREQIELIRAWIEMGGAND